jgi:hypothetical protein
MKRASASGSAESAIEAIRIRLFEAVASVAVFPATNPIAACENTVGIYFEQMDAKSQRGDSEYR